MGVEGTDVTVDDGRHEVVELPRLAAQALRCEGTSGDPLESWCGRAPGGAPFLYKQPPCYEPMPLRAKKMMPAPMRMNATAKTGISMP